LPKLKEDLPLSVWRKRRAQAERARRVEVLYLENPFKSRSLRPCIRRPAEDRSVA